MKNIDKKPLGSYSNVHKGNNLEKSETPMDFRTENKPKHTATKLDILWMEDILYHLIDGWFIKSFIGFQPSFCGSKSSQQSSIPKPSPGTHKVALPK